MTQTKAELLETKHQGDIRLGDANSSHYVGLKAPATVSSNLVWTLPATDGSSNQFLKTDGSGNLSWATDSATDSTKMPLAGGTFTGNTIYNDNVKAIFGTSSDGIEIFHDGSNSRIKDTGTGALKLSGSVVAIENAATTETMASFTEDGAVELYHNNVKKAETGSGGLTVQGQVSVAGSGVSFSAEDNGKAAFGNGDDLKIFHDGSHNKIECSNGQLHIKSSQVDFINAAGSEYMLRASQDGAVELYYDNNSKFKTTSTGVEVDGRLDGKTGGHLDLRTLSAHSIQLRTNNALRLNLQSDGHLVPYLNNTYDLGLTGTRFRNIYAETLYGSGANLTNLPASGGSVDLTASGAIAANKPVIINTSGQAVEVNIPASAAGSGVEASTSGISGVRVVGNNAGQFVIAWISSGVIKAKVATISSGTTVSYGSEATLNGSGQGGYREFDMCYVPGKDCYAMVYDGSGSTGVHAKTFSVSGTTITVGTGTHINNNNENNMSIAAVTKSGDPGYSNGAFSLMHNDSTYNRVFIRTLRVAAAGPSNAPDNMGSSYWSLSSVTNTRMAYHEGESRFYATFYAGGDLRCVTWTQDNNQSVSRDNTGVTLAGNLSNNNDGLSNPVMYEPNSDKIILGYTQTSNYEAAIRTLARSSSSSYALGNECSLGNNRQFLYLAEFNQKIYATYTDSSASNGSGDLQIRECTISGTTITAGTETEVSSDDHRQGSCIGGNDGVFIGYRDDTSSSRPTGYFFQAGSTNLTAENFVGFADAAISNGATGTINVVGNTSTQSSLTAGQKYYVQPAGTLSTTAGTPSVEAGVALSSTKLLIKG